MVTSPVADMTQLAPVGTAPSSPNALRAARSADSQLSPSTTTSRAAVEADAAEMGVMTSFQYFADKPLPYVAAGDKRKPGPPPIQVLVSAGGLGQACIRQKQARNPEQI
jgi:hypothetical protein